jgi:hypothetical protein
MRNKLRNAVALTLLCGTFGATPAAAELVDVFTFIPVVLPPYANDTPPGWSLTGSFEIPAADFSVANTLTLPNSDITALSFTLTYPDGSQVFTLADLNPSGMITFFATSTPAVLSTGTGFLVTVASNAYVSIGEQFVPGVLAFNAVGSPTTTTDVYGHWTSTQENTVPEPSTWALMLLGFVGFGWLHHRRLRNEEAMRV